MVSIIFPFNVIIVLGIHCRPFVCVLSAKMIRLSVVRLLLEASSDCSKDHLDVYDGWTEDGGKHMARLCGSEQPPQPSYLTDTNVAVVSFTSDDSAADAGFRVEFQPLEPPREHQLMDTATASGQGKSISARTDSGVLRGETPREANGLELPQNYHLKTSCGVRIHCDGTIFRNGVPNQWNYTYEHLKLYTFRADTHEPQVMGRGKWEMRKGEGG